MPGLQAGLKVDFSGYCGFFGDSVFAWFLVLTVEVGKVNLLWPYLTVEAGLSRHCPGGQSACKFRQQI